MNVMKLSVVSVVALMISAQVSYSEPGAQEIVVMYGLDKEQVGTYLRGLETGLSWYNVRIESKKISPLYCPPGKMVFETDQLVSFIRQYLKAHPDKKDTPAGLVLMRALEETFPCP